MFGLTRFPTIPLRLMGYPTGLLGGWFGKILLIGVLVWEFVPWILPQRPEMSPSAKQAVDHQLSVAMNDLVRKADEMKVSRLAVLHLDRDDSCFATHSLRQALFNRGVGIQPALTLGEKLRDHLNLSHASFSDAGSAIAEGRRQNVDAVVFGGIIQAGTSTTLSLQLADVHTGTALAIDTTDPAHTMASALVASFAGSQSGGGHSASPGIRGLVGWVAAALLLPLLAFTAIRDVARQRSNGRNLFVLAVFSIVDLLLLWIVLMGVPTGWLLAALLSGGFLATFYNVSVMTWAVKLEE